MFPETVSITLKPITGGAPMPRAIVTGTDNSGVLGEIVPEGEPALTMPAEMKLAAMVWLAVTLVKV
jgi:hypothetical protein